MFFVIFYWFVLCSCPLLICISWIVFQRTGSMWWVFVCSMGCHFKPQLPVQLLEGQIVSAEDLLQRVHFAESKEDVLHFLRFPTGRWGRLFQRLPGIPGLWRFSGTGEILRKRICKWDLREQHEDKRLCRGLLLYVVWTYELWLLGA